MTKLVSLSKPTVQEENKNDLIEIFERLLKCAKEGRIDACFTIVRAPDGFWKEDAAGNIPTTELVGKIEVAKQRLIDIYLKGSSDDPRSRDEL